MRPIRIIPKLEIKGPNLVKGVHLEGLRVLGRPEDFAYQYYRDGADELVYMDIVASLYRRNNLLDIVRRTAEKIFIPLTVGGGIRSVDDVRNIMRAGADKVAINTAALQDPDLIKECAERFGSQCTVVSIEARKKRNGVYEAFTDNGRQETGVDVFKWAYQAYRLGAGELLITSIDRDSTGEGYDLELMSKIAEIVPIPVIACGGAGRAEDFMEVIRHSRVSAVSAASVFHYNKIEKDPVPGAFEEGNIEFLKKYIAAGNHVFQRIQPLSIPDLKASLRSSGAVSLRPALSDDAIGPGEGTSVRRDESSFVVVVDFGCGNLFSISNVLQRMGVRFTVSDRPEMVAQADRLILPGVGSFEGGMAGLRERGLIDPVIEHARQGKPLLGICLGMQLLMTKSEEFGTHKGLDLIEGEVVKLRIPGEKGLLYKIPHIGWNQVLLPGPDTMQGKNDALWKGTILENTPSGSLMYFVHSYIAVPRDPRYILAETSYGDTTFCSVIKRNAIYGCQFHPEKSDGAGAGLLKEFVFSLEPVRSIR